MTKDVGNFIGITTDGYSSTSQTLSGVWSLFDQVRYQRKNLWPLYSPLIIGSDYTTTPGNGYTYYTFINPGSVAVNLPSITADILLVAGGGGGGTGFYGGGGGAGGLIYIPGFTIPFGTYNVSVGGGGAGGLSGSNETGYTGTPGSDTTFGTAPQPAYLIAKGGGGGGGRNNAAVPGGSGGGVGYSPGTAGTGDQPTQPGNSGTYGYGKGGGLAYGGGGGGATKFGGPGGGPAPLTSAGGGDGLLVAPGSPPGFIGPLIGLPALNPHNGYFAGGGGGGQYQGATGTPGLGGGGAGSPSGNSGQTPGVNYLGGGGGGTYSSGVGGAGGSGIVVIRIPV